MRVWKYFEVYLISRIDMYLHVVANIATRVEQLGELIVHQRLWRILTGLEEKEKNAENKHVELMVMSTPILAIKQKESRATLLEILRILPAFPNTRLLSLYRQV